MPIDFESGSVLNSDFTNFNGGTATVVSNPAPSGINTSTTVGRMIRLGGQVWAGAYLSTPTNVNFNTDPIICMKVYTSAPVGTKISLKMEGCGGPCFYELDAFTTLTGEWETLCYDFTGQPTLFDRIVFLFDLGNIGNGSPASTFYFDDVEQVPELPLFITPGSQLFCPTLALTLNYPGSGTYNWYADLEANTLLLAGSSSYTTPVLSGDMSYFVQDMTSTPFPLNDLGPSVAGGTALGNSLTTSTFFTSNLDNGLFHSVDIVFQIPTGPPPFNTCTYTVDVFNLTQGTSRTLTQGFVSPVNFSLHEFLFSSPLPIFLNDQLEMRITSNTGHPCYCNSTGGGDSGSFLPFPNSYDPQITFTAYTANGVSHTLMSGMNYRMTGDYVDPTLFQVNAIADCDTPLPVELLYFKAEDAGDQTALLTWSTASEINSKYFSIERSADGLDYKTIGVVPASGNSSTVINYTFLDESPYDGDNYYRLKQVDFDGAFEYFGTSYLYFGLQADDLIIFPNPADDWLTIRSSSADPIDLAIYTLNGEKVVQAVKKEFNFFFPIHSLEPGVYILSILQNGNLTHERLVVN